MYLGVISVEVQPALDCAHSKSQCVARTLVLATERSKKVVAAVVFVDVGVVHLCLTFVLDTSAVKCPLQITICVVAHCSTSLLVSPLPRRNASALPHSSFDKGVLHR